jgi:TQXA domain-containing protein/LPXTG-motif cell wall-anchored protein
MFKTTRRGAARLAAAGLAAGLLAAGAMTAAGPAVADDATPPSSGATATLGDLVHGQYDYATVKVNGAVKNTREPAGLFRMTVPGGGTVETYCIDFFHYTQKHATYNEVAWDQSTLHKNPDAGKIAWVLNHSYPTLDVAGVTAELKAAGVTLHHPLTPALAAAGTQVAIWHFSDPTADVQANDSSAKALSDFLHGAARTLNEPKPSLTLTPAAVSGKSGDRLGPVTVHTTAVSAQVALGANIPAGVKIVDKAGKPLTGPVKDGTALYFQVRAGAPDGSGTVNVTVSTKIGIGRAFQATDTTSQSQILAGSQDVNVTAAASLTWAKKGPIPALSAHVVCARNGVDVTATNKGDETFSFELTGKTYSVAPGTAQTITVPVAEDQKYKIDITLPDKSVKTFEGVLNCKTATPAPSAPANQPSPATSGGTGTTSTTGTTGGTNLAATGSSNATPVIAGIAVALVVVGGGAVFFFRRRKNSAAS